VKSISERGRMAEAKIVVIYPMPKDVELFEAAPRKRR
jgi:hypothetical protein